VCGRYSLAIDAAMFAKYFNMGIEGLDFYSRYNIAPSQPAPVISSIEGKRALSNMHWGLRPEWLKESRGSKILINARAETLCSKPTFRHSFEHRRCLIPADGYYEWIKNKVNGLIINDLNTNFLDEALKIDNINAWQINRNILLQKATIDVNKIKFIDIYNELINK